jgi:putative holliday junction resolvase
MRILCLDYGEKRIGVAVSDELGMTAQGLTIIVRKGLKRDMEEIRRIIRTSGAERIVVGYPLRLDGTAGIQCEKVDRFIRVLETQVALPVERWDEGLSTWEAEEILTEALVKRKKRKAVVDKIAAGIILQGYLNHMERKKLNQGG